MDEKAKTELNRMMARLADGDREAFHDVFETLWPTVKNFCMKMLRDADEAEDAAQQALEKIFSRASEYDATRPALAWAIGIAAWECRTIRKQHARRKTQTFNHFDETSDELATPEEALSQNQLLRAATEALGALSVEDQSTLIEGMNTHKGSAFDARFRKRKERALVRLRKAWSKLYGEI